MPPGGAESRATTAGKWLLAFVVVASALALGSILTEVLLVMSCLAAVACGLLWSERSLSSSASSRWVLGALAVLLGMTVLQAVPLPGAVTHLLAPANSEIWDRALAPLREAPPAWHSMSLAPAATRVEVLRGFFYGCVFLAALRVAALEDGDTFLLRVILFSTCVMALSALAHMAVGADKVFGIYHPREIHAYRAGRLAPLLNTNHLAAYLNIGACAAVGALIARLAMPRALSASVALVLVGTSVWQGSRGATGTLFVGVVLTVVLSLYVKRRVVKRSLERSRVANAAILAVSVAAAAFMVSIALSDVAREHLLSRDATKFQVARLSARLVGASPWFGVGRGAFESVFTAVNDGTTYTTFTHPEDGIVQWFVEWGVPVSLAGALMLAWALRPPLVLRAVNPSIGVWVAVVVAVVHELADYHFEVPGVVALLAVCVAIVVSRRARSRRAGPSPPEVPSHLTRYAAAAVVVGAALAGVWAFREIDHSLAEDRRTLSALAVDKSVSLEAFRSSVRDAMLRYPHEPFFPLMGAVRAQAADDGTVVAWVGRALELSPRFGRAHFILARSLASGHAAQARLEYRLAFEYDASLRGPIAAEGARLVVDADSGLEMVPDGALGEPMLEALSLAIAHRLPATATLLDREAERRSPGATGPLRRRIEAAMADDADGAAWCADKRCLAEGLSAAELLAKREPTRCDSHVLVAKLVAAQGDGKRAADGLEHALEFVSNRAECRRELVSLAFRTGQSARGQIALDQLVRAGCGAATECVDLYSWAGRVEEGLGHHVRAVRLYKQVLGVAPDREDLLEHIGDLGSQRGVLPDAIEATSILAARHPSDSRWSTRLAELRSHALRPPAALAP
jgi:tetratricopeptide (TPR) repeat protein